MSDIRAGYQRLQRRETHSPRSGLAIVLALLLVVVMAWVGTELVLSLLHRPALLAAPGEMASALARVTSVPATTAIASAIVLMVIGVVLVVAALAPGRRARHAIPDERIAVIVDNAVVASALARHAALAAGIDPDNTAVTVSHRRARVELTPTSGVPVDRSAVQTAVDAQLREYRLSPPVSARIALNPHARVGA